MRKAMQVLAITLTILGTAGLAYAQTPGVQVEQETEITGTVVSVTDQLLVIRTDDGELELNVDANTEQPADQLQTGDRVRVWHRADETTGAALAVRIERDDDMMAMADDPTLETDVTAETDIAIEDDDDVTAEQDEFGVTDDEYGYGQDDELPRTASSTPLAALLGTLTIAGAVGLRFAARLF